jgi:hypothetical protein
MSESSQTNSTGRNDSDRLKKLLQQQPNTKKKHKKKKQASNSTSDRLRELLDKKLQEQNEVAQQTRNKKKKNKPKQENKNTSQPSAKKANKKEAQQHEKDNPADQLKKLLEKRQQEQEEKLQDKIKYEPIEREDKPEPMEETALPKQQVEFSPTPPMAEINPITQGYNPTSPQELEHEHYDIFYTLQEYWHDLLHSKIGLIAYNFWHSVQKVTSVIAWLLLVIAITYIICWYGFQAKFNLLNPFHWQKIADLFRHGQIGVLPWYYPVTLLAMLVVFICGIRPAYRRGGYVVEVMFMFFLRIIFIIFALVVIIIYIIYQLLKKLITDKMK